VFVIVFGMPQKEALESAAYGGERTSELEDLCAEG
jgi:hypothetical protein